MACMFISLYEFGDFVCIRGSAFWYDVKQFHSSLEINGGSVEDYKRQQQLQLFSLDDEHDDFSQLSVNVIGENVNVISANLPKYIG